MTAGLRMQKHSIVPASWQEPSLHPAYLKLMLALLKNRGVSLDALPAGAIPDNSTLATGDQQLAFAQVQPLVQQAITMTGSPWLGLELGAGAHAYSHGAVGYAAVASGTVRQALEIVCRFAVLRIRAVRFELDNSPVGTRLNLIESFDLGNARIFMLEACLVIVERLLQALLSHGCDRLRYDLPWSPPAWADLYPRYLAGRPSFGASGLGIHLPADLLDQPCLNADPGACRSAQRECERQLLEGRPGHDLTHAVRQRLLACADAYPSAAQMAQHLHVSPRSLFRHLRRAGTSFHTLLDEVRCEQAQWQLQHGDDPVERIAERLGYRDTSNFSRTFRRWTGVTPSAWREQAHAQR